MRSAAITRTASRVAGGAIAVLAVICVAVGVVLAIATIDGLVVNQRGPIVAAILGVGLLLFLVAPAVAVQQARLLPRRTATPDRLLRSAISVLTIGGITTIVGLAVVLVVTPPL